MKRALRSVQLLTSVFARLMRDEAFSSSLDEPSQSTTIGFAHRNACPSLTSSLQLQPGKCWDPSGTHRAYPSMPVQQTRPGPGRPCGSGGPPLGVDEGLAVTRWCSMSRRYNTEVPGRNSRCPCLGLLFLESRCKSCPSVNSVLIQGEALKTTEFGAIFGGR